MSARPTEVVGQWRQNLLDPTAQTEPGRRAVRGATSGMISILIR
jgi:hypothetical protein